MLIKRADLIDDINRSTAKLAKTINQFPEKHFTAKPNTGGWSAAETAEHLYHTEKLVGEIVLGEGQPTTSREPHTKIDKIKSTFSNSSKKLTAFGPIVPRGAIKGPDTAIDKIMECRQILIDMAEFSRLEEECRDFSHPLFGFLTRLEWVYFSLHHGERHRRQMNKLKKAFS